MKNILDQAKDYINRPRLGQYITDAMGKGIKSPIPETTKEKLDKLGERAAGSVQDFKDNAYLQAKAIDIIASTGASFGGYRDTYEDKKKKAREFLQSIGLIEKPIISPVPDVVEVKRFDEDGKPISSPTSTPTPTPTQSVYVNAIRQGLEAHKADPAVLRLSSTFADLQSKYKLPDPYLVPILSIMETGAGRWFYGYDAKTPEEQAAMREKFKNNPYNWGIVSNPNGLPGTMKDVTEKVFSGIAQRMPQYQDYLKSGNVADLFKIYTPSSDPRNPKVQELVQRYNSIREAFIKAERSG